MTALLTDPETIRREAAWRAGIRRGAAEFAAKQMDSREFDERFLPESRDRRARSVTWRTWWEQRFGEGMTLREYCAEHGIHHPAGRAREESDVDG